MQKIYLYGYENNADELKDFVHPNSQETYKNSKC